jgi:hypothetical protein
MSVRTFCDCCGGEITKANTTATNTSINPLGRLQAVLQSRDSGTTLRVEVITGTSATSNEGHWCKHCVIDAINRLDDRPQPKAPEPQPVADMILVSGIVASCRERAGHGLPDGPHALYAALGVGGNDAGK